MPLPLFRFPFLALKVIVNQMDDIELVKLSMCSKKAERILKACGKNQLSFFEHCYYGSCDYLDAFELSFLEAKRASGSVCTEQELRIKVVVNTIPRISVWYNDKTIPGYPFKIESIGKIEEYIGRRRDLILNDTRVPVVLTDYEGMFIFWDGCVIDGLLFLLKCYNKSFRSIVYTVKYWETCVFADLQKFVDYTSSLVVDRVIVAHNAKIPLEDYKHIVENVNLSDPKGRRTSLHSYFKHDQVILHNNQIKADILEISSGNLISFQYLLECAHMEVDIVNSKFTNDQIKIFMEQWMNGKFPKLYSIGLGMSETFNFEQVLEGLPVCEKSKEWWRSREESPHDFGLVERGDGVIALLRKLDVERFIMEVDKKSHRQKYGELLFSEDDD